MAISVANGQSRKKKTYFRQANYNNAARILGIKESWDCFITVLRFNKEHLFASKIRIVVYLKKC